MFNFSDFDDDTPNLYQTCPLCSMPVPPFLLARHITQMHPCGAEEDVLSAYDRMHPTSASAQFARLVREAAEGK